MTDRLVRTPPEQQGVPSQAVLDFVAAAEEHLRDLHSFMLLRRGAVIAEGWWKPYHPDSPHMLYSLSKSFTATAVGLAAAEGRLTLDDPLISFFPDDLPANPGARLSELRVRHLLSMSTGHAVNTSDAMMSDAEFRWERVFLAQPLDFAPGTHFVYNNGATYMLAAIVQRLTGQTLLDYLTPRLFAPLGIHNPTWETTPRGVNLGFKGLKLKTEDIACFGQLYLDGGVWQGQRLLPADWVAQASAKQVDNSGGGAPVDWSQGYGFQFWRCQHNAYRGDGAFGQYCLVMPDQQAVLAITAGMADMQPALDLVWRHLLPAFQPAGGTAVLPPPLPQAAVPSSAAQGDAQRLAERLRSLEICPPAARIQAAGQVSMLNRRYYLEPNYLGLEWLSFHSLPGALILETCDKQGELSTLECGLESWRLGITGSFLPLAVEMRLSTGLDERDPRIARLNTAASAAWEAPNTLNLTARYTETPFVQTFTFTFEDSRLTLDTRANVGFGPTEGPRITGSCTEIR